MIFLYRILESTTIAIVKFLAATCCSLLQQPSLSPARHLSNNCSPSLKSLGGPEPVLGAVGAASFPSSLVSTPIYYSIAAPIS